MHKRSIGFVSLVHDFAHTLFNDDDFGIVDCGVHAAEVDLDIPEISESPNPDFKRGYLSHFIWTSDPNGGDLLAVICYECPSWFEPTKRRLALNDIKWLDNMSSVNDLDDFDPWSQRVLLDGVEGWMGLGKRRAGAETNHY